MKVPRAVMLGVTVTTVTSCGPGDQRTDTLDPELPNDPYTGEPFLLERDDEHVVLRADPPEGLFQEPLEERELLWRFEVDR